MYSGGLQKADNDIRNKIGKLTYRCNSYMNNINIIRFMFQLGSSIITKSLLAFL